MTNKRHAALYVAMKLIEAELKGSQMKPGTTVHLSNCAVTINIPEGYHVTREVGENGDGTNNAKATQNLYGYAVWAYMLQKLKAFNQYNVVRRIIMDVWRAAARGELNVELGLESVDSELAEFVERLKKEDGPKKPVPTTRRITKGEESPEFTIKGGRKVK